MRYAEFWAAWMVLCGFFWLTGALGSRRRLGRWAQAIASILSFALAVLYFIEALP